MILSINILLFISSYLPNYEISDIADKYFNPDYYNIEIIFESVPEDNPEDSISFFKRELGKEIKNNVYNSLIDTKIITHKVIYTLLYRLLPFMIDQPPPLA